MSSTVVHLDCPPVGTDRINLVRRSIEAWVRSRALSDLVDGFGSAVPDESELDRLVSWLLDFSDRWDFRRLQREAVAKDTGEGARWLLDSSQLDAKQKSLILDSAKALGLIGVSLPSKQSYDYVLALGGARLSCLLRPRLAAKIVDELQAPPRAVVMLGSGRPVADSERDATNTYAPDAVTEWDLINSGAAAAFPVAGDCSDDSYDEPDNVNKSWRIRHCQLRGKPYTLVSVSAPSSEPDKRRANSADTYEFFLSRFQVKPGSSLLLVTSEIYVPYQQLEAIRTVALPHDVVVETVGFSAEWGGQLQGMAEPSNYLQETRSTIQSAQRFLSSFPQTQSKL